MLTIEEFIAQRKQKDKINEFNLDSRNQNMKAFVDYVFEYFNNYLTISEVDRMTVQHNEMVEKYRKQLKEYSPKAREWAVRIYDKHGKYMNKYIIRFMKEDEMFFLFDTDSEFRKATDEFYSKFIGKFLFLKNQNEMLFLFIKDYHRKESKKSFDYGIPNICREIDEWIYETWENNQVNLYCFAEKYLLNYYDNEDIWPITHRKKSQFDWKDYDYDYKNKSNLFNIDSLYKKMPNKSFIAGKKQELEVLFMYVWLHSIEGDETHYWREYLESVLPNLNKKN